jgi:phosphate transport system protein
VRRNEHAAERVAFQDDEVDRLYQQVYRELLMYMVNDPSTIDRATWLLWAAHNLERVGDRIQNICERTVYEVSGVMRPLKHPEPMPE